jgi:hypothetical protein
MRIFYCTVCIGHILSVQHSRHPTRRGKPPSCRVDLCADRQLGLSCACPIAGTRLPRHSVSRPAGPGRAVPSSRCSTCPRTTSGPKVRIQRLYGSTSPSTKNWARRMATTQLYGTPAPRLKASTFALSASPERLCFLSFPKSRVPSGISFLSAAQGPRRSQRPMDARREDQLQTDRKP